MPNSFAKRLESHFHFWSMLKGRHIVPWAFGTGPSFIFSAAIIRQHGKGRVHPDTGSTN